MKIFLFQAVEAGAWQRRAAELTGRVAELEEALHKSRQESVKASDAANKLQRDLRENVAQKEDQEERIATLEKRYLQVSIFFFFVFFFYYFDVIYYYFNNELKF